jgi:hypothetical protein
MINPCKACGSLSFVLILAENWSTVSWGALPPRAMGGIYCLCGKWMKWPSQADVQAYRERSHLVVGLPMNVQRVLVKRGHEMRPKPKQLDLP